MPLDLVHHTQEGDVQWIVRVSTDMPDAHMGTSIGTDPSGGLGGAVGKRPPPAPAEAQVIWAATNRGNILREAQPRRS